MINSKKVFEKMLQNMRFARVKSLLNGDILDFGGNDGELKPLVRGTYTIVNYDHAPMKGKKFDLIVLLAVIEHIHIQEVYSLFEKFKDHLKLGGKIVLTTPTPQSKGLLEFLASIYVLDKQNIEEHKHYWNKKDIYDLANSNGYEVAEYYKFQLGYNQFAVFE